MSSKKSIGKIEESIVPALRLAVRKQTRDWKTLKKNLKEAVHPREFTQPWAGTIVHHEKIGPHHVKVRFDQKEDNDYGVTFTVDSHMSKTSANVEPKHRSRIANHVRDVVGAFIKHARPKSLSYAAYDTDQKEQRAKDRIYGSALKKFGMKNKEDVKDGGEEYTKAYFEEGFQEILNILMEELGFQQNVPGGIISHKKTVGPHTVHVQFVPGNLQAHTNSPDNYEVNFMVNHEISSKAPGTKRISKEHRKEIGDHLRKVVGEFVNKYSPKALTYSAYDQDPSKRKAKARVYRSTLEKLGANNFGKSSDGIDDDAYDVAHFREEFQAILKELMEDAPTINVGGGNIAGMGIGPQGEPGVSKKRQKSIQRQNADAATGRGRATAMWRRKSLPVMEEVQTGKFAGHDTFKVPSYIYHRVKDAKKHRQHWRTALGGDSPHCQAIRAYAKKNPNKPIVIEDEKTGYLTYARYGTQK